MMFRKYACGCIGVPCGTKSARVLIACDEDRDAPRGSLTWFTRKLDKPSVPLTEAEEAALHQRLATRLAKADRFDQLRAALGIQED